MYARQVIDMQHTGSRDKDLMRAECLYILGKTSTANDSGITSKISAALSKEEALNKQVLY
jgi:hypothetical protein